MGRAVLPSYVRPPQLAATGWLLVFGLIACAQEVPPTRQEADAIVLRASRILDGRGGVLENQDIIVRDGRIAEIVPSGTVGGGQTHDLTALTVLPGYIDTHVHIGRHFDANGRLHDPEDQEDPGHLTLFALESAYRSLMSGVTTLQSLGGPEDAGLKEFIARGTLPGPRVLTSLGSIDENTGSPEAIRQFVREKAAAGADVIKIFASTSIRVGAVTTLSLEQLEAACGEAQAHGLRTVVHAHRGDAVARAAQAGCTQIEHGWLLERPDLEVMAQAGMYFGNQIDLLFRNYAENGERMVGIASYTAEGFRNLQDAHPGAVRMFKEALTVPGLKVVFSTDAVSGGHGRNAQELVAYAMQGGQSPMEVVITATSRAAESLNMGDRIGSIAPGLEADIVALDGDPLTDPAAFNRVVFVMRAGKVYQNEPGAVRGGGT